MGKRKLDGGSNSNQNEQLQKKQKTAQEPAEKAVDQLPKASIQLGAISPYCYSLTAADSSTPPLPVIKDHDLATTPFKHSSLVKQNTRLTAGPNDSYERLEFLGDAYIELFASRLLFHRFAFHTPPEHFTRLLQIRESIVCNEILAEFAKLYDFPDKLEILQKEQLIENSAKDPKRLVKILGDSFEAFVAAVTLDNDLGLSFAEKWLAALWEHRVQVLARKHGLKESRQSDCIPQRSHERALDSLGGLLEPPQSPGNPDDFHDKALEFLGGAYIETFATRIVFARFEKMSPGRMSQVTEKLIKNDALARLARGSKMAAVVRIEMATYKNPKDRIRALAGAQRSHIGYDVLHNEGRLASIEETLLRLWAPMLLEEIKNDRILSTETASDGASDPKTTYDANAKALLQKRILGSPKVRLEYSTYQESMELKGAQLGQNRHFIACYLTGYGYERKLLGKGEGRSKAEAGNWAAVDAMYGDTKGIVQECEMKCSEEKERRRAEKLAEEAATMAEAETSKETGSCGVVRGKE